MEGSGSDGNTTYNRKKRIDFKYNEMEFFVRRMQRLSTTQIPVILFSLDYYKVLEVDYDATDEKMRINYRRLALKWHPDKHNGDTHLTAKFQEINEAYKVLSDPAKRLDYDLTGICEIDKYTLPEYLGRFKGMILTCNGLGISHALTWSQQLLESDGLTEKSA